MATPLSDTLDDGLLPSAEDLGEAIARLIREDAVSLPVIGERYREMLLAESVNLPYRPARPVVGAPERQVLQDFEICMPIPADGLLGQFARTLNALTRQALQDLEADSCPQPFEYNDLVMQRYEPGSQGISAHRDHVRYEGIVSLVILSGDATFEICRDRSGDSGREIPSPPGSILMMRGYRFAGLQDRPFHLLRDIRSRRVSFGLRYDTQDGPVAD